MSAHGARTTPIASHRGALTANAAPAASTGEAHLQTVKHHQHEHLHHDAGRVGEAPRHRREAEVVQEHAEVHVVRRQGSPVHRRDHQQHAQARLAEQRRARRRGAGARRNPPATQAGRREERAPERQPHRDRHQTIRSAAAQGQQSADRHRRDDVADGTPQAESPIHGAGAHARDREGVSQAADGAATSRTAPSSIECREAAREQHRREPEPRPTDHDTQDPIVAVRPIGQVRPRQRNSQREQRRQREHRRDLAARQPQPAQVRGHERHVDADRLVVEKVEDFDQVGTSRANDTCRNGRREAPAVACGAGRLRSRSVARTRVRAAQADVVRVPTPVTRSPSNVMSNCARPVRGRRATACVARAEVRVAHLNCAHAT